MEEIKNPIVELTNILAVMRKPHETTTTVDVLATAFKCNPEDLPSIVKGLNSIIQLVKVSKEAAEKFIPGDNARFIAPLDRIDTMFCKMNMAKPWGSSKEHLDNTTMNALDFGGYALSQFYPAANPENISKIREFTTKLDELLEECLNSHLSDDLKRLFSRHLEALRDALLKYRLDGSSELDDAIDNIVGSILRNKETIRAEPQENKEIIEKFFDMLTKVNTLVSGYQSAALLAAPVASALLLQIVG